MANVLLRHRDIPDINKLEIYKKNGGFDAFKNAVTKMKPNEVTDVVKNSGLRGRGGAGFPTGMKWAFIDNKNWPHYVVANADESEPGTFKDREIMESNPFQFFEGALPSLPMQSEQTLRVFTYAVRSGRWPPLDERIVEMEEAGYLGKNLFGTEYSLKICTHLGAGAYICGEETAMLESMEGKRGQPRVRPPFPPSYGLYGKPTIVNNVETLTNVPLILANGADWYKKMGTADSAGMKIFSLSGRVRKPGNYELPFGTIQGQTAVNYQEPNRVKTRFVIAGALLSTLFIIGCARTPKVSPNVTAILNDMSEQQATEVIQRLLPPRNLNGNQTRTFITGHIGLGLCKANQFSLDEERWPDLQVTAEEISFNAVRSGAAVTTPHGKIPTTTGMTSLHRSERIAYREHLRFDKIESVTLIEPRLLRTLCGRPNGQSELFVRETTGRGPRRPVGPPGPSGTTCLAVRCPGSPRR